MMGLNGSFGRKKAGRFNTIIWIKAFELAMAARHRDRCNVIHRGD
jgi:hypothetical protein